MEWMINARLVWFLESNVLLSNIQCGFRQGRSTLDRFKTFVRNAFAKKEHAYPFRFRKSIRHNMEILHFKRPL